MNKISPIEDIHIDDISHENDVSNTERIKMKNNDNSHNDIENFVQID